jgi:Flp pilus assembly protein TadD
VLDPNLAAAHRWYAHLLLVTGHPEESLARGRRAVELDPMDPGVRLQLGHDYLLAGLVPEAESELDRARRLDSTRGGRLAERAALSLGLVAERRGDYPLAEARYRDGLAHAPEAPSLLAALGRVHALAGRPDEARALLQRLDSLSAARYVSPFDLALVADGLGDRRRAFAWLDAALADRTASLVDLAMDPRLERLRGDRRFIRIARAVGLPPREGGDYNPPTSTPTPRPASP